MFLEGWLIIGYQSISTNEYKYKGCQKKILSESCPNNCFGKVSIHVGGCPMDCFGELSNNLPRRIVQRIYSNAQ